MGHGRSLVGCGRGPHWVLAVKSFLRVAGLRSRDANDETKPPNGVFDRARADLGFRGAQNKPNQSHRQTVGRQWSNASDQPSAAAFSGQSRLPPGARLTFASPGGRVNAAVPHLIWIQTVSGRFGPQRLGQAAARGSHSGGAAQLGRRPRLATPVLRAIRCQYPKARIAFLVKSPVADVLSGGDWMDEVIHWPVGKSRDKGRQGFLGLAGELRKRKFDWAVLLTNSFRSALLARLAGVKRRIGYDREGRGLLLTDKLLPEKAGGQVRARAHDSVLRGRGPLPGQPGCRPSWNCSPRRKTRRRLQVITAAGVGAHRPIVVVNPGIVWRGQVLAAGTVRGSLRPAGRAAGCGRIHCLRA